MLKLVISTAVSARNCYFFRRVSEFRAWRWEICTTNTCETYSRCWFACLMLSRNGGKYVVPICLCLASTTATTVAPLFNQTCYVQHTHHMTPRRQHMIIDVPVTIAIILCVMFCVGCSLIALDKLDSTREHTLGIVLHCKSFGVEGWKRKSAPWQNRGGMNETRFGRSISTRNSNRRIYILYAIVQVYSSALPNPIYHSKLNHTSEFRSDWQP